MKNPAGFLNELISRYPSLSESAKDVEAAFKAVVGAYEMGGKVLVCGNGGSAADADHIVGELMKGFLKKRELPAALKIALADRTRKEGAFLGKKLQGSLPAINLSAHSSLTTAFANDVDAVLVYAQQVLGYGKKGDVLIGISTSGNARNVVLAVIAAKALGLFTVGMTGRSGGKLKDLVDCPIRVPAERTHEVQELHLPVYHCLCAMIEEYFY